MAQQEEQPAEQCPIFTEDENLIQRLVERMDLQYETEIQVDAVMALRELVLPQHKNQRCNQDRIRTMHGALERLAHMVGHSSIYGKFQACFVLAQLAWRNEENSSAIPMIPYLSDYISAILADTAADIVPVPAHVGLGPADMLFLAQEQACVMIGNCCANSKSASEKFAADKSTLAGFCSILRSCQEPHAKECAILALKNCAASSQEAAHSIVQHEVLLTIIVKIATPALQQNSPSASLRSMAIGAINSFSRNDCAVELLNRADVVHHALKPALYEISGRTHHMELTRLTVTSAVANLSVSGQHQVVIEEWAGTKDGKRAVENLVKCLGMALNDRKWGAVSFSPHSVICPLYNIAASCPRATAIMLDSNLIRNLAVLLCVYKKYPHAMQTLELGVRTLDILAIDEVSMISMRNQELGHLLHSISKAGGMIPGNVLEITRNLSQKLVQAPLTVMMGTHPRLGYGSQIQRLQRDTLEIVLRYAFYSD